METFDVCAAANEIIAAVDPDQMGKTVPWDQDLDATVIDRRQPRTLDWDWASYYRVPRPSRRRRMGWFRYGR